VVVESASGIGLTRRLGEEEYCKNRAQDGPILGVPLRMADLWDGSDRETFFNYCNRARRVYYGAVFEIKKEIPANSRSSVHPQANVPQ